LMPDSADARELHGDALEWLDKSRNGALERWLEAVELGTSRSETYFKAGEVLVDRKEFERAAGVYMRAGMNTARRAEGFEAAARTWDRVPHPEQALYCRAAGYAARDKYDAARVEYNKLARSTDSAWRKRGLDGEAEMLRVQNRPAAFLKAAQRASSGKAGDHMRLANAYLMLGDRGGRIRELQSAAAKDASVMAAVESELALLDERAGRWKEAVARYKKAAKAAPRDPHAWKALARIYLARPADNASLNAALDAAGRAAAGGPNDPEAFMLLGKALKRAGRPETAIEAVQHAIDLDPRNPQHFRRLAAEQRKQGDTEGAAESERLAVRWDAERFRKEEKGLAQNAGVSP
jgi:tetratricopeptide (TPR) repeat protein